jgi:hypothetical protein
VPFSVRHYLGLKDQVEDVNRRADIMSDAVN